MNELLQNQALIGGIIGVIGFVLATFIGYKNIAKGIIGGAMRVNKGLVVILEKLAKAIDQEADTVLGDEDSRGGTPQEAEKK